jgi:hypothetical protein
MFDYLRDGDYENGIVSEDFDYFENVKILIKEGAGILEQQLVKQENDTNTKINFIEVLISIGLNLNSSPSGSICNCCCCKQESTDDSDLTDDEDLETNKESKEISEKLTLNFKDVFHCLQDDVQIDNYLRLLNVII